MNNKFQEFDVYCHSHLLSAGKNVQMVVNEVQYWCPVAAPNTCTIYIYQYTKCLTPIWHIT